MKNPIFWSIIKNRSTFVSTLISRSNSAGLVLAADLDLGVECSFATIVGNIGATSVISEASSLTGGTSGAGELQFVAEYFTSDLGCPIFQKLLAKIIMKKLQKFAQNGIFLGPSKRFSPL